jgi:hypothetical protein
LQKIAFILVISIFICNCSVTRNRGKDRTISSNKLYSDNILESVRNQNITDSSFFIQKAEIEVTNEAGKESFIGNIRFEFPDKYLISLKNKTGIEGARIFISNDTILVNDRINKKLYSGTPFYLKRNYGLSQNCLPVIFGDIVTDKSYDNDKEKCLGDRVIINCLINGIIFSYNIDCIKRKVISVDQINNLKQKDLKINYDGFFNVGNILIPRIVELLDINHNIKIRIKVLKVEYPWKGILKFIPGDGYELIKLV